MRRLVREPFDALHQVVVDTLHAKHVHHAIVVDAAWAVHLVLRERELGIRRGDKGSSGACPGSDACAGHCRGRLVMVVVVAVAVAGVGASLAKNTPAGRQAVWRTLAVALRWRPRPRESAVRGSATW